MSEKLALVLQKNKSFILEHWEKEVRQQLSAARKETKTALRDSIPAFLDDLVIALKDGLKSIKPDIIEFAHKHGSERANASDYSIEDALYEYSILRRVIFMQLEAETTVTAQERDIIYEAINFGMRKAGAEYAKRQMKSLHQERAMLEAVIEQMPSAVWIADAPSGEIMLSNSHSKEDLFYRAFHQSNHILARTIETGGPCQNEIIKIKRKGFATGYIRLDASSVTNHLGQITHGVAIGTDVSDLYAAQEEMMVLFELAGTGKAVVNSRTGKILRVNKALCEMLKLTQREILQKKFSDFTRPEDGGDQKRFIRQDGTEFWGEIFSSVLPGTHEEPDQSVCTIIDISERKKIEEYALDNHRRLQLITDIQPILIGQVDKELRYQFVNRTYQEWYELPLDQLIGKRIVDVLGEKAFSEIAEYFEEALKGHKVVYEKNIQFQNGVTRYLHCTYSPGLDKDGNINAIFISVSDYTEQRKVLEAFQQSEQKFRQLALEQKQVADSLHEEQVMRDKFISALSHDLRTPLTTASISAELITRKSTETKISSLASKVSASLNRVNKMIEDLLDANSFQAGNKFIPELHEVNVVSLAQSTLDELTTIYGERFILDSTDAITAYLSPTGIRRVLENLCTNAIKYGAPTAPVTISLSKTNRFLNLGVHNFGIPLKASETSKLFNEFVRSSSAEKSGKKGWGIGLSIVKGVIEAHGGNVDIKSDESGTLFQIKLPLDARSFVMALKEGPSASH